MQNISIIIYIGITIGSLLTSIKLILKLREKSLSIQRKRLEQIILDRTKLLNNERAKLEISNINVINKNNEIIDSIRYAKILQDSIMMPVNKIKEHIPEIFILYKPKDIVSGDFYYHNSIDNKEIIVVADCTGHGVPGAFMSIIGNNLLDQAIGLNKISKPSDILDYVNSKMKNSTVNDGMDIALCLLDIKNKKVQYSGAYNQLWIIKKDERVVTEIKADKFPIGRFYDDRELKFTNHEFQLEKGDTLYLFSDGYADQFGGIYGKKFKYKRLKDVLIYNQDMSMDDQKAMLENTFNRWMGSLDQVDDVLIIGIRMI